MIASLLLMRLPRFTPHEQTLSMWEGFGYIGRVLSVFRVIALVAAGSLLLWSVSTLYPVFADRFKQGAGGFSMMMSANGIGAAAGGILMTTIGPRLPRRLRGEPHSGRASSTTPAATAPWAFQFSVASPLARRSKRFRMKLAVSPRRRICRATITLPLRSKAIP